MIVVEGPDGSGKTTLCKELCGRFDLKMGERQTKNRDEIYRTTREDSAKAVYQELLCNEPSRVWDRIGYISDPIYSSLGIPNKRPCAFSYLELQTFWHFAGNLALVIVCLPELEIVQSNTRGSHQLRGVSEKTEAVYCEYSYLNYQPGVFYDYTNNESHAFIMRSVEMYLETRKEFRECLSSGTPVTSL